MDKKAIEIASVSAVKTSIALTDLLEPYINENDKEPSWDGNIIIYNKKILGKVKNNILGRISTQIKGHEENDFSKSIIKFSMHTVDLNNYLNDGGIILFVVYVTNTGTSKIYYTSLLPIKLRLLLNEINDKKSKAIELKEFPTDENEKINIFLNFFEDKLKQASYINAVLLSLDDYKEQGVLESCSISITGVNLNKEKFFKLLFSTEVYMYAKIKGCPIPQPLEIIPTNITTSETVYNKVCANEKQFYSSYIITRTKENCIFKIGKSFTITFNTNDDQYCQMNYKTTGTLKERIIDIDFIINAILAQKFYIGSEVYPVNIPEDEFIKFDFDNHVNILKDYREIQYVLDLLNVKDDFDIKNITDDEASSFSIIIAAFINHMPVNIIKQNLSPLIKIKISNIVLMLTLIQDTIKKDKCYINNFFDINLSTVSNDEKGANFITSQYALLHKKDYIEISNIDYDKIYTSFLSIPVCDQFYDQVNYCLLEMLNAYDEVSQKNKELINLAINISKWLLECALYLPYEVRLLNYYQIIRRERELSIEEKKQLYDITINNSRDDILVGAHLLLNNQFFAEIHFQKLTPQMQDNFKLYPIYKFWNI